MRDVCMNDDEKRGEAVVFPPSSSSSPPTVAGEKYRDYIVPYKVV